MSEVVRLDAPPPPWPLPRRRRAPWVIGLVVVLAVVAVGLLDAQSRHREQHRRADATAFSVRMDPDGLRQRAQGLTLTVSVRNTGPVRVTVQDLAVGALSSNGSPVQLAAGAERPVELSGTIDCARDASPSAQVAVSLPGGDRTVDAVLQGTSGLCAVLAEPLRAVAAASVSTDDGLSVPLTVDNLGPDRLRLIAVRVRSTTATVSDRPGLIPPDPASMIILPARSSTLVELRIATPPSCHDLARFLDAPVAVLRYDSGSRTPVASLRVPIDRSVLPDPHDVCG